LQSYLNRLDQAESRKRQLEEQLAELVPAWSLAPVVTALQALKGIQLVIAATLVAEVGDFSRELCGGTHVGHGSQVGPVHVLGEASIGANLRRIEALTGLEALHYVDRERQLLAEVAALLKTRPEDAPEQLRRRLEALATAQRELERLRVAGLERLAAELAGRQSSEAGGWLVAERVPEAGADDLRRIASGVRDRAGGDCQIDQFRSLSPDRP
jgi:alanyl-tRNA synthetase